MKKIVLYTLVLSSFVLKAQTLSYSDMAVFISMDENYGTARFVGLSGAFGALGGDMTAVDINPAGLAVYDKSEFSTTLSFRDTDYRTSFYGTSLNTSDDYFRFSQVGGLFGSKIYGNSKFEKIAFGFNYNVVQDFSNNFVAEGNSGIPDFVDDPYLNFDDDEDNNVYYENVENQFFGNFTSGLHDRFSFSFASQYEDWLYLGASMSFYHLNYYQNTIFEEFNNDGNGNTLDAYNSQYLTLYGNGFNFGIGGIIKPVQNLRLGFSFQSPVWYNLSERFIEDIEINVSNDSEPYTEYKDPNYFDYDITTPSKLTGSIAYVFGKMGLVSFDYIYQDYKGTKLKPSGAFIDENQELSTVLKNTSSFKLGTEWRHKLLSFRGGYRMIQNPYKDTGSSFDLNGYSLGLGINFANHFNLDFAYDNASKMDRYNFLSGNNTNPALIDINTDRFTTTFVFKF